MNRFLLIFFCAVLVLGGSVFRLKYQVVEVERKLFQTQRNLATAREAYHLLQAEWSYLTAPERLNQLAEKHLPDWSSLQAKQMEAMNVIGPNVGEKEKSDQKKVRRGGVTV